MKHSILLAALLALSATAHAGDAKVEYVGNNRYSCEGDSYKCARIQQENQRESERQRQSYQRDQDRAQDYVDRQRQREDEYMRRTYGRN